MNCVLPSPKATLQAAVYFKITWASKGLRDTLYGCAKQYSPNQLVCRLGSTNGYQRVTGKKKSTLFKNQPTQSTNKTQTNHKNKPPKPNKNKPKPTKQKKNPHKPQTNNNKTQIKQTHTTTKQTRKYCFSLLQNSWCPFPHPAAIILYDTGSGRLPSPTGNSAHGNLSFNRHCHPLNAVKGCQVLGRMNCIGLQTHTSTYLPGKWFSKLPRVACRSVHISGDLIILVFRISLYFIFYSVRSKI